MCQPQGRFSTQCQYQGSYSAAPQRQSRASFSTCEPQCQTRALMGAFLHRVASGAPAGASSSPAVQPFLPQLLPTTTSEPATAVAACCRQDVLRAPITTVPTPPPEPIYNSDCSRRPTLGCSQRCGPKCLTDFSAAPGRFPQKCSVQIPPIRRCLRVVPRLLLGYLLPGSETTAEPCPHFQARPSAALGPMSRAITAAKSTSWLHAHVHFRLHAHVHFRLHVIVCAQSGA